MTIESSRCGFAMRASLAHRTRAWETALVDRDAINAAADQGMLAAYWAAQLGDALQLVSDAGNRTFAEANANANRLVRALRARGVKAGDGLALMCSNRPEFV